MNNLESGAVEKALEGGDGGGGMNGVRSRRYSSPVIEHRDAMAKGRKVSRRGGVECDVVLIVHQSKLNKHRLCGRCRNRE